MAPTIEGLRIKLTPFSHHWGKNLGGCHEQDKNKASAPVWIFLSSHTLKGEMHMKRVQCLFLTSQAKGHDSSVPLLCLSQGQLQMPDLMFSLHATVPSSPFFKYCLIC